MNEQPEQLVSKIRRALEGIQEPASGERFLISANCLVRARDIELRIYIEDEEGLALTLCVERRSSSMLLSGDVDELEVEEESRRDPAINGIVRMKSRVINHPLNKLSVHLDDKLHNSDGVQLSMLEGAEEAVELEFRLRVVRLAVVEGDGAETTRILLLILSELEDNHWG